MPEQKRREEDEAAIAVLAIYYVASINDYLRRLPPETDRIPLQFVGTLRGRFEDQLNEQLFEYMMKAGESAAAELNVMLANQELTKRVLELARKQARTLSTDFFDKLLVRLDKLRGEYRNLHDAATEMVKEVKKYMIEELVAITAATEAYSFGELAAVEAIQEQLDRESRELETLGAEPDWYEVESYWMTEEDERVCPICAPLHGLSIMQLPTVELQDGPPAHPRCRCWLTHRIRIKRRGNTTTGA
jgi:hypothetical protein